ncbi:MULTISPECIES: DUF1992 domain-containing protein [unclassified Brenneria]|uniref:DnaJ family domain-containing protein n=1 Tax=unclassified Brenneria TaxID=2634434 RepID=UPI0015578898|nr:MULTISPECIES: DUF1992 domain-containing protein [unclassified Brenneria]MBJ7224133.1 DUF1992 domain-containing protein [Brenneria sp. L3-3C-1]MEE3645379.1 DUF1992 domain-containing protein [Brenneria sp. L3_3C_1]MEE3653087.1 DUF1992 domain-containing protein [Brenneria sp. HEZEL_4_2_4]NPD03040.1 DUF1992 domain-containing protein [Brenneria sp. hezel4-2-4]
MWLIDEMVERHIAHAQQNGVFDNLPGSGRPLVLDDDSAVPPDLRVGYRLLKNAGCLPVELQERKEALALADILQTISRESPDYQEKSRRLRVLELNLRQKGINTDFLHGEYASSLKKKF